MKNIKYLLSMLLVMSLLLSINATSSASAEDTFSDVASDAWYAEAVKYVHENGLMGGTSAKLFSPNANTNRGMLAAILYRTSGSPVVLDSPHFTDVAADVYYADAVAWVASSNIMSGYGDGKFGPSDPVSREQIATILWRYAGSPDVERGQNFSDESSIAAYAATAVDWARANGIVNGMEGNRFYPKGNATRAQVAAIIQNYMTKTASNGSSDANSNRVLVAYFSRVGNTNFPSDVDAMTSASINLRNGDQVGNNQLVAEAIHTIMGGDLAEIKVVDPYPADYDKTVAQNRQEQQDGSLPSISMNVNMEDYDIVFVGYPIWAMTLPAPVKTFLTQYDFSGKTIVPLCTHAGYGAGRTEMEIRELCPNAQVRSILAVDDDDLVQSNTLVSAWLSELKLSTKEPDLALGQKITIRMGNETFSAELNNTPAAQEFARSLPLTVSMTRMGEHEYYGALENPLSESGNALQTGYTVGDLAFWTTGDLFALYFDEPETPPQGLIILGHITSDLSAFQYTSNRESVRIELDTNGGDSQ